MEVSGSKRFNIGCRKRRDEPFQNTLWILETLRQKRPGNCPQSSHSIFWLVPFPRNLQDKTSDCLLWIHSLKSYPSQWKLDRIRRSYGAYWIACQVQQDL